MPTLDGGRRQVRRQGFTTETEANRKLRELLDDVDGGVRVDPAKMTVATYLTQRWLPTLEGRGLSVKTVDEYRRAVRVHLVPHLGTIRLQALDTPSIEHMLSTMARAKKSAKTRRNVHGVLSKSLTDARRWNLVARNAATGVELPKLSKRPPRAWNAVQLALFLDYVDNDRLGPLWRFFVISGARRGEVAGLRWRDVDLEAAVATITNNRIVVEGGIEEKDVKSDAGNRTVALDARTVTMLRRWRTAQRAETMRLGIRPEHDYVFTGVEGGPLWPHKITERFSAISAQLGLPSIDGPQGLRHSAATFLVSTGQSPKEIARRLGHDVVVLLRNYAHAVPGGDEQLAAAFADALDGARRNLM